MNDHSLRLLVTGNSIEPSLTYPDEMKPENRIMAILGSSTDISGLKEISGISSLIIRRRSYALEIDLHTSDPEKVLYELCKISEVREFRKLNKEGNQYSEEYFQLLLKEQDMIIHKARIMFKDERYWEAHTALEDLWKVSSGKRKTLLQGIIIIAASMTHYQMEEPDIAERMYTRGLNLIRTGSGKEPKSYGYSEFFKYPCPFPEVI